MFEEIVSLDRRSETLDKGNVRLTFEAVSLSCIVSKHTIHVLLLQLVEKAESREKARVKADERKVNAATQ